jgi:hypothetical protein
MEQTLGVWLRETREAKGSTLEDVAAATRIRPRFLVLMEDGDFAAFPGGELQARGFLRIVARHLSLSADEVLARYQAEVHGVESEGTPSEQVEAAPSPNPDGPSSTKRPLSLFLSTNGRRRGPLRTLLIWGTVAVVVIGVGASIAYLLTQGGGGQSRASAAEPTPIVTQLVAVPQGPPEPTATPTVAPDPQGGVTVALEATEHVWVRVTADDRIAFVGFLSPQEIKSWSGDEKILVETGNAAAVQVTVNDRPMGALGARGEVASRTWGPNGEIETADIAAASVS